VKKNLFFIYKKFEKNENEILKKNNFLKKYFWTSQKK